MSMHAFEKLSKHCGIKRISKDGVEELMDIVNEYGMDIAIRAVQVANHRNCRTVQKKDIEFASGKL
jgi:histone H3/H4